MKLLKYPLYILLLPLFFVLHGWSEYFAYISGIDIALLAGSYLTGAVIVFGICLLIFRDLLKAGIYAFLLLACYYFFGAIQDTLKTWSLTKEISRYKYLLSLLLAILIVLFFQLKRANNVLRLNRFLIALLIILLALDITSLVIQHIHKKKEISFHSTTNSDILQDTDSLPDIYFLLCDEYAGSASLKQFLNYNNYSFDSALTARGFHSIPYSKSNYNFTPFSMASIFNMSYLTGISDLNACTAEDYAGCDKLIKNNEVITYLSSQGYTIINYSVFDLKGNPSLVNQSFLPLNTRLITDQTLFSRMKKDLGHLLLSGKFEIKWLSKDLVYTSLNSNNLFIQKVKEEARIKRTAPKFVYAHYFMPHAPYYFDSSGNKRDIQAIYKEIKNPSVNSYLQYVPYTNRQMLQIIDTILANSTAPPVIILMGDHGFRKNLSTDKSHYFSNMNAIYLPGRNYTTFYDSISGVNQFRALFNTLFHRSLPLLQDTSYFLTDKQ